MINLILYAAFTLLIALSAHYLYWAGGFLLFIVISVVSVVFVFWEGTANDLPDFLAPFTVINLLVAVPLFIMLLSSIFLPFHYVDSSCKKITNKGPHSFVAVLSLATGKAYVETLKNEIKYFDNSKKSSYSDFTYNLCQKYNEIKKDAHLTVKGKDVVDNVINKIAFDASLWVETYKVIDLGEKEYNYELDIIKDRLVREKN